MSGVIIENYEKNTLETAGRADSVESRTSQDENGENLKIYEVEN